nr:amino acid transporter AVT1A-like [Leptinotarsa decemlineata]
MNYGSLDSGNTKNEKSQSTNEETAEENTKGLGLISAALFIAGEMAGSGILALPQALVNTGPVGVVLLLLFCFNAAYGGIRLGNCWQIVEQRYPEHRIPTRNPYSVIALRAIGKFGSSIVSICVRITLFGAGTVYLLLSSQIIQELLLDVFPEMTECAYFLLIALSITPMIWLSSPKDFRFVGLGAILTTVGACLIFLFQIIVDAKSVDRVPRKIHGFHDFFISFGTILFAFGGASTFPTIQNDMKNKNSFSKSVTMAFIVIMLLYFPISYGGYAVYGEGVNTNLALSLTKSRLIDIGNILMAIHLIFAFLIVMNPVFQDVEESFNMSKNFSLKRCFWRSMIMAMVILVGETVPQFGKILSLIGGSTITLLTFVFPPYFYMKLSDMESQDWPRRIIPLYERVYIWELIAIGVIGGGACTFSAVNAIFGSNSLSRPCYWR